MADLIAPSGWGDTGGVSRSGRKRAPRDEGARLIRVRETLGLSQREMADELGVTHGAIGQWESRARPVPGPVRKLLALFEEQLGLDGDRREPGHPPQAVPTSWAARTLRISGTAARLAGEVAVAAVSRALADEAEATAITRRTQTAIARKVVAQVGAMKGFAMKLGQMASYMDFAAPADARDALASLQTQSRPMAPSLVAQIFLQELGASPRRIFADWSPTPFAAASIGQVHRARLSSGEEVAVKVQYPGIVKAIESDLRNAALVNQAAALVFRGLDPGGFVAELRERLLEECDYRNEAANQQRFRGLWKESPVVHIPRVFEQLTTARILVTELARGASFHELQTHASQAERDRAGEILFQFAFESIARHGLFNADPHPGNFLFAQGGVVFLDFGCVKVMDARQLARWKGVMRAMLERDFARAAEHWIGLGVVPDPARFDFGYHHRMILLMHIPWLMERPFRFTPDYVQRTWHAGWIANRNRFRVNMPKDWVFLNRLDWGLHAVLAKLGAEGSWRPRVLDLLYQPGEPRPRPYTPEELDLLLGELALTAPAQPG